MKLTILLLCIVLSLASVADANFIVQILFNNGNQCSSSEWSQLEYLIYVMSQKQRNLRGGEEAAISKAAVEDDTSPAQSELWLNYCANRCDEFVPRSCMALNCRGYRRRSLVDEMTRGLFWSTDCNNLRDQQSHQQLSQQQRPQRGLPTISRAAASVQLLHQRQVLSSKRRQGCFGYFSCNYNPKDH